MNSARGAKRRRAGQAEDEADRVVLNRVELASMRQHLHELANILTGVMISGGLLSEMLTEEKLRQYAFGLCQNGERGRRLVWELRGQLLAAATDPAGEDPHRDKEGGEQP